MQRGWGGGGWGELSHKVHASNTLYLQVLVIRAFHYSEGKKPDSLVSGLITCDVVVTYFNS